MKAELIAPCGMNCGICIAYLREKKKCPGCREMDAYESSYGRKCIIRRCHVLKEKNMKFCSDKCDKYPCRRLRDIDKRYRTKYEMSMIENLENIKEKGIRKFVKEEKEKWTCKKCGGTVSCHRMVCYGCGKGWKHEKEGDWLLGSDAVAVVPQQGEKKRGGVVAAKSD